MFPSGKYSSMKCIVWAWRHSSAVLNVALICGWPRIVLPSRAWLYSHHPLSKVVKEADIIPSASPACPAPRIWNKYLSSSCCEGARDSRMHIYWPDWWFAIFIVQLQDKSLLTQAHMTVFSRIFLLPITAAKLSQGLIVRHGSQVHGYIICRKLD